MDSNRGQTTVLYRLWNGVVRKFLLLALDDSINPKTGRKVFACQAVTFQTKFAQAVRPIGRVAGFLPAAQVLVVTDSWFGNILAETVVLDGGEGDEVPRLEDAAHGIRRKRGGRAVDDPRALADFDDLADFWGRHDQAVPCRLQTRVVAVRVSPYCFPIYSSAAYYYWHEVWAMRSRARHRG